MAELEAAGARLYSYARTGAGLTLVMVHGGMCDHRDWGPVLMQLTVETPVLLPDLRCHGRSTGDPADCSIGRWADDVLRVIDAFSETPVVLVGHSLASRVVLEAASRAPEWVRGVVLLDGSRSHGGLAASAPTADQPPPPASLAAIIDATIGPYADSIDRAAITATMSAASPALMAACVDAMRDWDLGRADLVLAALAGHMPVLAIQSTYHDRFTPRRSLNDPGETTPYLAMLRAALPQLEVRVLPETGHFSMRERPHEVAALIAEFADACD